MYLILILHKKSYYLYMKKIALLFVTPLLLFGCTKENYVLIKKTYPYDIPTISFITDGIKIPSKDDEEYDDYAKIKVQAELKNDNEYGFEFEEAKVRIRGTSSRYFDKKGYKLKFNNAKALIGKDNYKTFHLLASFPSPDKLRDYLPLTISSTMAQNDRWTPKLRPVNLIIDNVKQGLYYLIDDIKDEKNRIEFEHFSNEDDEIPFIVEMDTYAFHDCVENQDYFALGETDVFDYDGDGKTDLLYKIDEPKRDDGLTDSQFDYIKNYITKCRLALQNKNIEEFKKYVDLNSFIDFFTLSEFFRNTDHAGRSTYMYRLSTNSKLIFGPSWDFDYTCSRKWSLEPNQDYTLDNVNDRFYNFDWWKLFLNIDGALELINKRWERNHDIINHELNEVKNYFMTYKNYIIDDSKIWYTKYCDDVEKLVLDNYNWYISYITKRLEFYDSVFA